MVCMSLQDCESANNKTARICTDCFARGREFGEHRAHHRYTVVKSDFSLLEMEPDWTAEEESQLLASLLHRGLGNWEDIAKVCIGCQMQLLHIYRAGAQDAAQEMEGKQATAELLA